MPHVAAWNTWIATTIVIVAFALGVASDALGPSHRVNLLAPPLLALLVWNVAVYAALAARQLVWRSHSRTGPVRSALGALVERGHRMVRTVPVPDGAAILAGFARAWADGSRDLSAARVATTVHTAAATLVLGALCSLYLRGLALEYRASWESTFLDATGVHALLSVVLGPASRLSGIALPDVAQLAALRFGAGPGENAARWIHLYAITLTLAVILPRAAMALLAAARARRLAQRFPLPLDDAYFARLRRAWSGSPLSVHVMPYSYHLSAAQGAALRSALENNLGPEVDLTLLDTAPLGAEDDLARWLAPAPAPLRSAPLQSDQGAPLLAVLFPMAATPEREHHGALLRAVMAQRPDQRVLAVIDESGFRRRQHGASLTTRLEERRRAWRTLLDDESVAAPLFVDLDRATESVGNAAERTEAGVRPATGA